MQSIRARLLAGTLGGACVLMSALGLGLQYSIRSILTSGFDEGLMAKTRALSALVEEEDGEIEAEFADYPSSEFSPGPRAEYYLLWSPGGQILARSPSLDGGNLPQDDVSSDTPLVREWILPDGRPGRYAAIRFEPRPEGRRRSGQTLVLAVAKDTLDLDHALEQLRFILLGMGGAGVLAMCGLMVGFIRSGLRPLHAVADQIESLDANNLSQRLPLQNVPAEMVPVVSCLNGLLRKLEAAFARERSFTADVAHDLRTPLAGLRSTLEVALSRERGIADYRNAMTESLAVTQHMQTMTDNLLALARAEAGQLVVERTNADVQLLLQSTWRRFAARAAARELRVGWIVSPAIRASTDPGQFSLALSQLFENVITHTNDGGEIRIEAEPVDQHVRIQVSNTGNLLSAADAPRVFERFWRGDKSRVKPGLHCGLGLSLARRIVELLGGAIRAEVSEDWFTVCLELPAADQ